MVLVNATRSRLDPVLPGSHGPRPGAPARCLLIPLHTERALARALVQHLADELPEFTFTLGPADGAEMVWLCGYEAGHADMVRALRARHPRAMLLVTARDPEADWAAEVCEAGADETLAWPAGLDQLSRILRRRALRVPA